MRPFALAALVLAAPLASAQDADAQDADAAVRAAIVQLFDGMRTKDTTAIRRTMHPAARLMTATASPAGARAVVQTPIDGFVEAVATTPVTFDERIGDDYPVLVDGALAVAWVPYRFYAGDDFSHCGTNAVTLAQMDDGWQIVQVVDTRRREGCDGE